MRVTPVLKGISIHLMLLFNYKPNLRLQSLVNFNTSNVTIQHAKYRCCKDLKYYFNTSNVTIQRIEPVFLDLPWIYFNTSNVTIQQGLPATAKVVYGNFNTSNVTIQQIKRPIASMSCLFQYI